MRFFAGMIVSLTTNDVFIVLWCRYRRGRESGRQGQSRSPSRSSPPITSTTAAPTLVGDGHSKIMRAAPAFLGCPSSQRCGAGEVETKGGADFMGHSRAPLILKCWKAQKVVFPSQNSQRKNHFSEKHHPIWIAPHWFLNSRLLMITNGFEYHILNCLFIHKNSNYFSKNISTARGCHPLIFASPRLLESHIGSHMVSQNKNSFWIF